MTVATSPTYTGPGQSIYEQHQTLIFCLLAIAAGLIVALVFSPAYVWPEAWVLPIKQWISDMFRWLDKTGGVRTDAVARTVREGDGVVELVKRGDLKEGKTLKVPVASLLELIR